MRSTVRYLVALPLASLVLPLAEGPRDASALQDPEIRQYGDVAYVTGGVGQDEREAIEALARAEGLNLRVVLAQPSGAFLSDVPVEVLDADGEVRLETDAEGPWVWARLPAGEYQVRARFAEGVQETGVEVGETGTTEIVLTPP